MVTLFGISNFTAVEYSEDKSIEQVALENEYVIKRIKCIDTGGNWHYNYIILDKLLERCKIEKNGWKLSTFNSYSAFNPRYIPIDFTDPKGKRRDIPFKRKTSEGISINILNVKGLGTSALNDFLECFVDASKYHNWLEYIKSYPDIIIDENYLKNNSINNETKDEIELLKQKIDQLQNENNDLNNKIKKIKDIIH